MNTVLRTLTFTPAENANDLTGPVQIRMTTDDQANGGPGALTDTDVFAVSVTPVNDAPTTSGLAPVAVAEDAPATSVTLTSSFADVEDGAGGLTYAVVGNTNPGLFGAVSVVNGVLTLNYTPNASGSGTLTVRATDAGGLWVEAPLVVTVAVVNDAPTSAGLPPVSVAGPGPAAPAGDRRHRGAAAQRGGVCGPARTTSGQPGAGRADRGRAETHPAARGVWPPARRPRGPRRPPAGGTGGSPAGMVALADGRDSSGAPRG